MLVVHTGVIHQISQISSSFSDAEDSRRCLGYQVGLCGLRVLMTLARRTERESLLSGLRSTDKSIHMDISALVQRGSSTA